MAPPKASDTASVSSKTGDATPAGTTAANEPSGEELEWFQKACADVQPPKEALNVGDDGDDGDDDLGRAHAVMVKSDFLWPHGTTLTYAFLSGKPLQHKKVEETIKEWERYINLRFKRGTSSDAKIRIRFDKNKGSWSYVGALNEKIPANKPTMNLGWVNETREKMDPHERGTILHEFGHALGLMHEHQSPARGGTITLDLPAVYRYYTSTQGWDMAQVKSQIVDVYNTKDVSNYSGLDTKSIMMYFMPAAMNKERIEVPPNTKLTDTDKAFIMLNYCPDEPHPDAPDWTLPRALDQAGVKGAIKDEILELAGDPDAIRDRFSSWCIQQRWSETDEPRAFNAPRPVRTGHNKTVVTAHEGSFMNELIKSTKGLLKPSGGRPYIVFMTQEGASTSSKAFSGQVLKSANELLDPNGGRPYTVIVTQEGK